MSALDILCAQLTRDLFAIAKFLLLLASPVPSHKMKTDSLSAQSEIKSYLLAFVGNLPRDVLDYRNSPSAVHCRCGEKK